MKMDHLVALQSLLVLFILPPVVSVLCPRSCSCPQPAELHCTFRSLITIPPVVSKHVERMNLGFNSINNITDKSLAGLSKLELLMVHGNDIHSLPTGVFRDLSSLQMLKMSYNKLKEINRHTLQGLWALVRFHLDHNHLEFIHPDAFQGLTSLRLLQLEGNRLQQLHPATFTTFTLMGHFHVSTLRHLYLSDNELTTLPSRLVATMPQLENLYLHGNPWVCDCNMQWFRDWDKTSPGVLKCKKDRSLPGGQLCPICSSPRHLQRTDLQAVENLVCSSPVISSLNRTSPPDDINSEVLTTDYFREPFGNISLDLSDEHGNEVHLECSVGEPGELAKINWEQVNQVQLVSNLTLSMDLECPVNREKYEQLWRLIAYYSNVPAHLKRGVMLRKQPHPTYVYKQDSEKDAQYYTGVKVNIMAQPDWLMQTSADLQLNRLQSSAKMVKLTLSTALSETVDIELVQRQRRIWVMIESTNTTRKALSAILGSPSQMDCNVHSSGRPAVHWMLPDGSKVAAPYNSPDNRVFVSTDGRLVIKSVSHTDTGIYYCVAKVHGDFDVMPFHLIVQESSIPSPGEEASVTPIEGFAGNPISLPCTASGSPDAEINWILPNNNIVHFHANTSRALVYSNGTLHIPQTQIVDSGHYKCIAINQHGVDTLATKVTFVQRKGQIRPLRKFPARPQSASGMNTKIKVPTEDTEEASGDVPKEGGRLDPLRRRIPAGVAPGRRGVHQSRTMWRRPPLLRKPTGSQDRKNMDGRRKINMSKSKIDPEKWADILAKIRDKNAQSTPTPLPFPSTTQRILTTQAQDAMEGSSDGTTVQEKGGHDDITTPNTPTSSSYTSTQGMTSDSQNTQSIHVTAETQATYDIQHTTQDMNLEMHTTSNNIFFPPQQTTSVPQHAVTFWQANTNTASSSSTLSHSTNTDVDGVKTAGVSKESEIVVESSNNDREDSPKGGQIIPSVNPNGFERSQDDTERDDLSEAMVPAVSATTFVPRRRGSGGRLRQPNSRRRNGGRRRKPKKRKEKLNKPTQFVTTTPENAPLATGRTTGSMQLKIEPLEVTTAYFFTTVPFSSSQAASSGRLSHEESIESGHGDKAATEISPLPVPPSPTNHNHVPSAKPLFESTSSFPTASPGVGHGKTSSQTALTITETPPEIFDMLTSITVKPLEDTQWVSVNEDLGAMPNNSLGDFYTQTDAAQNQSITDYQYTTTEKAEAEKALLEETAPSVIEHELMTTSEYTSSGFITTQSTDIEMINVENPTEPETYHHHKTTNNEKDTASVAKPTPPATTAVFSRMPQHVTQTIISSTGATNSPSLMDTTPEVPRINDIPDQDQQIQSSDPATQSTDHKLSLFISTNPTSPALTLTSGQTIKQTATSAPTTATIQTNLFTDRLLTSTQDVSRKHQLPGPASGSTPKITKSNFQTLTVEAEADAELPCVVEGEPVPFLSWAKVTSGTSVAQITGVQRFEVFPNGTLIIRKTQPMDGGQYLCTVQNQYGTDSMVVNVLVQSQHPRILQPRHREITVDQDDEVNLECNVEGHPNPRVTWVLPNNAHVAAGVTPQQHVSVFSNGTLRINRASYADRGIYKCIGSSAAGADTVSVRLYVSMLPPVIQQTQHENITILEGGAAYIHCTATGDPQPVTRWITPDGVQLTASQIITGRNLGVFPNGTLYIRALGQGNAGRYECSANNGISSSTRTVILSIRRNPTFAKASITLSSPQRMGVIYGGRLLLNCVATGSPEPRIIWRTPSKKLVDAQYSFDSRIKVFVNGTISVQSVTEKDSGDYLCLARNKMGDDYVLLRVDVLTMPAKIEQKQQRSRQEVVYGGDLKVDCVASGLPNPEISWALPDGTMVNLVKQRDSVIFGRSRRYVVFDNGTLYFNHVGMPEEGDYTCYAENQLGKDEMKVQVKVKAAATPPQIQDKDQKVVKVFYGETVTLTCNTKGEPKPIITWISPTNRVISPSLEKYQILDDGTLVVQKVQRFDGGNYTCMSKNNAGQDHKVIKLEVIVTSPVINGLRGTANAIKVTTVQDQRKLVDCVAKGTPTPRVMWVLPGNVILPAPYYSNRMTVHKNGTLEIRSVKRTDSGQLACIARNEGGEVRLLVNLDVKTVVETPQIRGSKMDTLTVGNTMTLNCSFEGLTLPHVTWILPNGATLHSGARFSKFFHQPGGSLIISNPSVSEAGMYRCLGHNSRGLMERTITLSLGRKPEIMKKYNSPVSVANGERLLLHCVTSGEPLTLTWTLPSGVVLNRPQRAGRYAVLPNGTLSIQQVSVYDRGSYMCRVANQYGSTQLPVSVIVIAYPPRITNGPPSVTYAKHGVAVQLNCIATGIPKVDVAWETPDKTRLAVSAQPRLFGNKYLHPQGSLIIQNPTQRDAGVYRCTARNAIGVDSKSTILNVF